MERAVDGNNIALGDQLLECVDTAAANLGLLLSAQGLVVIVQKLLAVEWLEPAQDTLANAANSDGSNNLALKIEFVLGGGGDVPVTGLDHLVRGDEVADEDKDGHDDVLGHGYDVGASDFGNGDTTVGLVRGIQVNMVRTNTSSDGKLEVLRLGETLGGQVAGVEAILRIGVSLEEDNIKGGELHKTRGTPTYGVVMMTSASTSSWSNLSSLLPCRRW